MRSQGADESLIKRGETRMDGMRRTVLKLAAGAAGWAAFGAWSLHAQDPSQTDNPAAPRPAAGRDTEPHSEMDAKRIKAVLEQNQKDIKKNIEKLFQLVSELKEEVSKTDAMTTLSLAMVRKTEEIEKLARQIRDKAKG
jgi:hypothetical protein